MARLTAFCAAIYRPTETLRMQSSERCLAARLAVTGAEAYQKVSDNMVKELLTKNATANAGSKTTRPRRSPTCGNRRTQRYDAYTWSWLHSCTWCAASNTRIFKALRLQTVTVCQKTNTTPRTSWHYDNVEISPGNVSAATAKYFAVAFHDNQPWFQDALYRCHSGKLTLFQLRRIKKVKDWNP